MVRSATTTETSTPAPPLLQLICFSMDRVFQLSEYLRTLHAFVRFKGAAMREQSFARVAVICRCTSAEIRAHYEEIEHEYAPHNVTFLYESDTQSFADCLLLSIANGGERGAGDESVPKSPYVMFNVDDAFYFDDVELTDAFAFLDGASCKSTSQSSSSVWPFAFHVKLAPSIWRSHLANKPMLPLPPMQTVVTRRKCENGDASGVVVVPFEIAYHVFDPARGTLDWNYPWELSGSVYLRSTVERVVADIQAQFGKKGINHPNHLELRGHQVVQCWATDMKQRKLQCACPLSPKMHVFAINQVQDVFNNRLYEAETDSLQEGAQGGGGGDLTNLLRLYKANETLDEAFYRKNRLSSVHIGTLVLKAGAGTVAPVAPTELVSVIIPVFNVEKYVEQALLSIMKQSYQHLEILVVDDASTDTTPEIIARLQAHDSRIRYLRNATNVGVAASLNRGFAAAKGVFIARMDGDDVSLPQRIERQVLYLRENPQVAIVGTSVFILREGDEDFEAEEHQLRKLETAVYPTSPLITKWRMLFGCFVGHPTVMIRREVLDALAPDASGATREYYSASQSSSEDYELWLRCLYTYKITILSMGDALVIHRKHPSNVSTMRRDEQINETHAIATKFIQSVVNSSNNAGDSETVPNSRVLPLFDVNASNSVDDLSRSIAVLQKLQTEVCSSLTSSSKAAGDELDCEKEYIHQDAAAREGELALKSMLLDPIRGTQLWSSFAMQHPRVSRNAFEKLFRK